MKICCYVIVSENGDCKLLNDTRKRTRDVTRPINVPELLEEGWRPVRETCMGGGNALILLEKETD
ncbi:MAG: hypothetical protein U1D30_04590 [Planctomycetota bacterium]